MTKAAYFDLDGTLVGTSLIQPTAYYLLNQASPLKTLQRFGRAIFDAPRMAVAEMQDRRTFNEILFSHFRGMTEDRIEVLSREVFEDIIRPAIFSGAHDLIRQCKEGGFKVVIVTGSLDVTTRYVTQHLGADYFIANRLEFKDGYATGKMLHPLVAGPEKAKIIVEDAHTHGYDLKKCHAYSDSFSDVPMLSVVGHAFCINPSRKLKRLAQAYRWPILDINNEPPASFRKSHSNH